jgi:hypothetical protein
MNKILRVITHLLVLVTAAYCAPLLLAEISLDGTWKLNARESKLPPEPFTFSLDKGIYSCPSCANSWSVKANGTDQPLPGTDASVRVTTVDPRTVEITFKRNGKIYMKWIQTVSEDGNNLNMKTTLLPGIDGKARLATELDTELKYARLEPGPPGAHAVSGSWRDGKAKTREMNRSFTYQSKGDEVFFSDTTGVSYHAKLDGPESPVKGGGAWTAVSLKRIDDRTILETDKEGALVSSVSRITVSPDGNKLRMVERDPEETGQVFSLVADRQQ